MVLQLPNLLNSLRINLVNDNATHLPEMMNLTSDELVKNVIVSSVASLFGLIPLLILLIFLFRAQPRPQPQADP